MANYFPRSVVVRSFSRAANVNVAYLRLLSKVTGSSPVLSSIDRSFCGNRDLMQRRWLHVTKPTFKVVTFKLADIGEGIAEVEILRWHKSVGEKIDEMEDLCEVQSDKAAVEISSRYTGNITKHHFSVGDLIKIGQPLCDIDVDTSDDSTASVVETPASEVSDSKSNSYDFDFSFNEDLTKAQTKTANVTASPATRRLAKELNIDISLVKGTGRDGRISKSDVEEFAKAESEKTTQSVSKITSDLDALASSSPKVYPKENIEVPLRGFSRAMFKAMTETALIPHMNIADECDVTELLQFHSKNKTVLMETHGVKLTITSLLIKAMSLALSKNPVLNSKVDPHGEKYTMFANHNISVAIDTPHGLVVPNIKEVENLSVAEVQKELHRLSNLALNNKLSSSDLTGGTVSLSNVGSIAGTYIKSLLFDGQALILGVGRTQRLPRFDASGNVVARDILNIAASADHRHCDGATTTRFIADLRSYLENPMKMLLYLR